MAQIKLNATYGLTGTLPAVSGANLTTLNATNISSGTLNASRYVDNGSLVLTASATTAGSTTSIDIADAFNSTYQSYLMVINRWRCDADDRIGMRFGTSSAIDSTADCQWTCNALQNDGTEGRTYTGGTALDYILLNKFLDGADEDVGASASIWIHYPYEATPYKIYHGTLGYSYTSADNIAISSVAGSKNNTTQFTHVQLYNLYGNDIRSGGTIRFYGLVDA
jgi:hypothetical protein